MTASDQALITSAEAKILRLFQGGDLKSEKDVQLFLNGGYRLKEIQDVLYTLVHKDYLVERKPFYRITQTGSEALERYESAPTDPPPRP